MPNKTKIAVVGAGGFGREVFHLLNDELYECIGFIDYHDVKKSLKAPIIGHESEIEKIISDHELSHCIVAIGNIQKRKQLVNKINKYQLKFPLIYESSISNYSHDIGDGTVLFPGVVIMNDCKIGNFTLLNSGVTLGHDVIVGDFCNINPGVHLAGRITIGDGTLIGIGTSIKENVRIGMNVIIGAGSVVLNDVPDNTIVYGVPARPERN